MSPVSRRPWFSIAALILTVIAALVSVLDGDSVELAFFVLLALAALTQAWLVRTPDITWARRGGQGIAIGWVVAAVWIGVLLAMYQGASRPPPAPEEHYLGLTATVYHLVAVYAGALLVAIAAFGPRSLLDVRRPA